jgi:hypothetical protein
VQKDLAYLLFYAVPPTHQLHGPAAPPPPKPPRAALLPALPPQLWAATSAGGAALGALPRPALGFIGPAPPPVAAAPAAAAPVALEEAPVRQPRGTWAPLDDSPQANGSFATAAFAAPVGAPAGADAWPVGAKRHKLVPALDAAVDDPASLVADVVAAAKAMGSVPKVTSAHAALAQRAADHWRRTVEAQAELYFSARTSAAAARVRTWPLNGGSSHSHGSESSSGSRLPAEAAQAAADARLLAELLPAAFQGALPPLQPARLAALDAEVLVAALRRSLENDLAYDYLGPPGKDEA